jgi:hypothetical protein
MKRLLVATAVVACGLAASGLGVGRALAKDICVGNKPQCSPTLQAAVAAAQPGDKIKLGQGTFAGRVVIDKDLSIEGAGAGKSIISGGGPVLRIGTDFAPTEPTVSIKGVTVTGGHNDSYPFDYLALGGGIFVPPGADQNDNVGGTLTIENSVVTGNAAMPSATTAPTPPAPFWPHCPGPTNTVTLCPFGGASGGGIASYGPLTLKNVTVSNNLAGGPLVSDADGGGILVGFHGSLTMENSTVSGNVASVGDPVGRFAEGGGIFAQDSGGTDHGAVLTIKNSTFTNNVARLNSALPFSFVDADGPQTLDMSVNGGAIHSGDGDVVSVENTKIDGNRARSVDLNGEVPAFDGGFCTCGDVALTLKNSEFVGNEVSSRTGSTFDVGPTGPAAFEADGVTTIQNVTVSGNTATASSPDYAGILGAVGVYPPPDVPESELIQNTKIWGNTATATSFGIATVMGAGVSSEAVLGLQNDQIGDNVGTARGASGFGTAAGSSAATSSPASRRR